MILGILADAHGNIYGLKRCFELLKKTHAKKVFFLGDAINYFSKTNEVLDFLKANKISCIKGNHEKMLLNKTHYSEKENKIYNIDATANSLLKKHYHYIASWEDRIELNYNNVKILMVHGSPFDCFNGYVYPDTDLTKYRDLKYDVIFLGHTHIPFMRHMGKKRIINVGSAGFSRDDGRYLRCFVYNTMRGTMRMLQTRFPDNCLSHLKPFHRSIYNILKRRKIHHNENQKKR